MIEKNLELFSKGLQTRSNWKFTDLNFIINKNFKNKNNNDFVFDEKIKLIDDFDHNHILLVNGLLKSYDMRFEEEEKVKIESLNSFER